MLKDVESLLYTIALLQLLWNYVLAYMPRVRFADLNVMQGNASVVIFPERL